MVILVFFTQLIVVIADSNHLPHQRGYNEKGTTIHGTDRIVDNNDFVFDLTLIGLTAHHQMIEVEEGNKVPLTLAKILIDNFFLTALISYQL